MVGSITYQNPETGFTVARLAPERRGPTAAAAGDDGLLTVVGTLFDLTPGEAIIARGWWRDDAKHGWQFQAAEYQTTRPATLQGMKKYLGSGLVKGIGPVNAGRIVDTFGEATFEVIDTTPARLTEVPGIGPVRAGHIAATWEEQRHIREVMASLQGFGLSTSRRPSASTSALGTTALQSSPESPTVWRGRCGALGSRPPTRSRRQ